MNNLNLETNWADWFFVCKKAISETKYEKKKYFTHHNQIQKCIFTEENGTKKGLKLTPDAEIFLNSFS